MNNISKLNTRRSFRPSRVYDVLKRDVEKAIVSGELKAGDRIKGVLPLSEEYGISKESACNAVNELAKEGLVTKSHGRGIFVNKVVNNNGKKKRKNLENLDVLMVFGADPLKKYPSDQNRLGVTDVLSLSNSKLHLHSFDYSLGQADNFRKFMKIFRKRKIDGMIFRWHVPFLLRELADLPIVFCNQHLPPSYYHRSCQVCCSAVEIAYTGTELLLRHGHRLVGLISTLNRSSFEHPSYGYATAFRDYTFEFEDKWILDELCENDSKVAHQQIIDYFRRNPELTGVYVSDDYLCFMVLNALTAMGKNVPNDVSVVSFANKDNVPAWPLEISRIEVDQQAFGLKCGETLMQLINGEILPGSYVGFSPTVIEGETVRMI